MASPSCRSSGGGMWVEKAEDSHSISYRCMWSQCRQRLEALEQLEQHINDHLEPLHEDDHHVCPIAGCEIVVGSVDELSRHMKMHLFHAQKQFNGLAVVDVRFPQLRGCNFPSSSRIVYQGEALICEWDNCLKSFIDINEYFSHLNQHIDSLDPSERSEEGHYYCLWGDCDLVTRSKACLRTHVQHHSGDKMCACPFCGGFFANNTKLIDHVARRQEGTGEFSCFFCQKSFKTARLLAAHCQRHVRNYKCNFPGCSMALDSAGDLRRHAENVHAKIRNHLCDQCHKGFFQRSDLNKHISTVHSAEPTSFACSTCGKEYKWAKQLRHHLKSHEPDCIVAPYLCHLCQSTYRRGSALSKHFTVAHSLDVPEGFSRFQYKKCSDGMIRLQTRRCLGVNLLAEGADEGEEAGEQGDGK